MKRPLPTHLYTQRVSIYRNLNQKCLSIMHKQKITGHAASVILQDVCFQVQEGGRQRCLQMKKKKVHAFVKGVLMQASEKEWGLESTEGVQVTYNPYKAGYFYERETGKAVYEAKLCIVTPAGVLAYL